MPILRLLDTSGILRVNDVETIKPINPTTGRFDNDRSDYLRVSGNGAVLVAGNRSVDVEANNDDATVTAIHLRLLAKGGGVMIPRLATAALPAGNTALRGLLVYDTNVDKLKIYEGNVIRTITSA